MGRLEPAGEGEPGGSDLPWGLGRSSHAPQERCHSPGEGPPSPTAGPASLDPPEPVCCLQCGAAAGFQWPLLCIPVSLPHARTTAGRFLTSEKGNDRTEAGEVQKRGQGREDILGRGKPMCKGIDGEGIWCMGAAEGWQSGGGGIWESLYGSVRSPNIWSRL